MATQPMFDPAWDDWDEDLSQIGPLPDFNELGAWSVRQHGLRIGRESFLAAYKRENLNEALVDALTHIDLGNSYSPDRIRDEVIGDDPELLNTFELYRGPDQAELDLHLEGPGVTGHTTDAKQFSKFISKITGAVAAASKLDKMHARARAGLLIEGAAPGSVRVVFKSAPAFVKKSATPGPDANILFDAGETSTSDSVALREIANILSSASDADNFADDELGAALGLVPAGAHNLLFEAITTAASAEWEIHGSVRQRGIGRRDVTLTKRGASRLTTLLRPMNETVETLELRGTLDGYKPSEARMWLRPEDSQRSLVVLVQTPDLLRQVKELNAVSEEVNVAVTVRVRQRQSVSSGQVQSTTRDLVSVAQIP